jgi:hypothetical protein
MCSRGIDRYGEQPYVDWMMMMKGGIVRKCVVLIVRRFDFQTIPLIFLKV